MLCLGMKDKAIKMLLESTAATNPSEPLFYEYNLRACLAATCRSAPNDTAQNGKLKKLVSFSIAYQYYSPDHFSNFKIINRSYFT